MGSLVRTFISRPSVIAALLGFGGVAGTAMEAAKLLFWATIVLCIVSLFAGRIRRV